MQSNQKGNTLNLPIFSLFDGDEKLSKQAQEALNKLDRDSKQKKKRYAVKRWTSEETLKYFIFVNHHIEKFESESQRLPSRIFKLMSQFIKTRNCDQCRSHHQKTARTGTSLQLKLNSYKEKNPSFAKLAQISALILKTHEDESFYLKCDSAFTEDQKKIIQENLNEKLSPATAIGESIEKSVLKIGPSQIKQPQNNKNTENYQEKIKQIMFYYQKWENLMEELIEAQNGPKEEQEEQIRKNKQKKKKL